MRLHDFTGNTLVYDFKYAQDNGIRNWEVCSTSHIDLIYCSSLSLNVVMVLSWLMCSVYKPTTELLSDDLWTHTESILQEGRKNKFLLPYNFCHVLHFLLCLDMSSCNPLTMRFDKIQPLLIDQALQVCADW